MSTPTKEELASKANRTAADGAKQVHLALCNLLLSMWTSDLSTVSFALHVPCPFDLTITIQGIVHREDPEPSNGTDPSVN